MNHHNLIHSLIVEIRNLRQQIIDLRDESETTYSRMESAAIILENELRNSQRLADVARSEANYQEDKMKSAMKDLERARAYEDEWAEKRAMDKLRRLG